MALRDLILLSLCLVVCGGCARPRLPSYPIGVFGVRSTNDFAAIRGVGFNLVAGSANRPYLDAAHRAGLRVLASPHTSAGSNFNAQAARQAVAQFDDHPALWAWYLVDEPDLQGAAPELIERAQRFLKNLPARKPTALVLCQGAAALDYANIADITMIDRYPIAWLPLANFGQHVRLTRLALGKSRPLIAVIQCFDWSIYPALLPVRERQRPPTYAELRCMVYCALAERATGLFFYAFDDGRWRLSEHPETRHALEKVVQEINARQPLFQAEHCWWPYAHEFRPWQAGYNAALQSSVSLALLRVRPGKHSFPAGEYILAVNNTDRPCVYRFSLPRTMARPVPVLDEERNLDQDGHWANDEFPPYGIHVYGPLSSD
jgi:hypothetical protein